MFYHLHADKKRGDYKKTTDHLCAHDNLNHFYYNAIKMHTFVKEKQFQILHQTRITTRIRDKMQQRDNDQISASFAIQNS